MSSSQGTVASKERSKYATPADIPPELYDLILHFLGTVRHGDDYRGDQNTRNKVVASKKEIGALALVCKSWAELCQRKLFVLVVLSTGQDLHELLDLAAHPLSRIAEHIETAEFIPRSGTTPWIHEACMKILPRSGDGLVVGSPFPNYTGHTLRLVFDHGREILREGLYALLPRRNPAFLQNIKSLHIEYSKVDGISDIARLVKELPDLEAISLNKVLWTQEPNPEIQDLSALTGHRVGRQDSCLYAILVTGCSAQWVGLSVAGISDGTRCMCDEDLVVTARLANTMMASVEGAGHTYFTLVTSYSGKYTLSLLATLHSHLAPDIEFVLGEGQAPGPTHVDTIRVDFVCSKSGHNIIQIEDMLAYDWATFDKLAAGLSALRQIEMRFGSQQDLSSFVETALPKMPLMYQAEKLKYAVLNGDGSKEKPWTWVTWELSA